jgi:hypothetical protein
MESRAALGSHPIHPFALVTVTDWLGGKLVYEHHVAVSERPVRIASRAEPERAAS